MSEPAAPRPVPARPAASLALLREGPDGRIETLMGQRGGGARFMPSKVVFPGGRLDPADLDLAEALSLDLEDPRLDRALEADRETGADLAPPLDAGPPPPRLGAALALAAIRETFEETGLRLAHEDAAPAALAEAGESWPAFGARPTLETLGFFYRAITPPSQPIRFDARLFVASATDLIDDPDDLSRASGELSRLAWTPLEAAAELDLPFVTHLAVAELQAIAAGARGWRGAARTAEARPAPFFRHAVKSWDPTPRSRIEAV